MSKNKVENPGEKDIFIKIIERFEKLENKPDRYQIASEEFLASLRDLKEKRESQLITDRLVLTLAGSKGDLTDEYNNKGKDARCLVMDSKLICLEILRNEWIEN